MTRPGKIILLILVVAGGVVLSARAQGPSTQQAPATQRAEAAKIQAVVFDFASGQFGKSLADSIRLRVGRHEEYEVVDRLTTQEFSGPLGAKTPREEVIKLMRRLACEVGLYGTASPQGSGWTVEARCIDLRGGEAQGGWSKTFSDNTERSRPVIALQIVEALRGQAEWVPPQYGDEPEPRDLAKPLNLNGDFEKGRTGWEAPDNLSTFLVKGPPGRGTILRVRTDLPRDPWLAYRRALLLGKATLSSPPSLPKDTSYESVAGLEGVHFAGDWIAAEPGQRYWLTAEHLGKGGAKVFVKGFLDFSDKADGLPESSLAELDFTPEQFAALAADKQQELIRQDAKQHPERYRRECYRWYLNCGSGVGKWTHLAAPFPPRGGLPKNVKWLQIQIYSYWPPGEYLWDNVNLYKDPNQKAPVPEEAPRTPNFDKRW